MAKEELAECRSKLASLNDEIIVTASKKANLPDTERLVFEGVHVCKSTVKT